MFLQKLHISQRLQDTKMRTSDKYQASYSILLFALNTYGSWVIMRGRVQGMGADPGTSNISKEES